jgi:hypothetical protein
MTHCLAGDSVISIECVGTRVFTESPDPPQTVPLNAYVEFSTSPSPWARLFHLPIKGAGEKYPEEWSNGQGKYLPPTIRDAELTLCFQASGANGCYRIDRITGALTGTKRFTGLSIQTETAEATCSPAARRNLPAQKF